MTAAVIARRSAYLLAMGVVAFLVSTGVAGAQEAADNSFTENSSKFMAAGIAMGLVKDGDRFAVPWMRQGTLPRSVGNS